MRALLLFVQNLLSGIGPTIDPSGLDRGPTIDPSGSDFGPTIDPSG